MAETFFAAAKHDPRSRLTIMPHTIRWWARDARAAMTAHGVNAAWSYYRDKGWRIVKVRVHQHEGS